MISRIKSFLQESRQEVKKVNWPTRAETLRYTIFVVVLSIVLALFLGALD
ncbi:MAG: preprotein translocase subunit SecE, partial [Patescibacteria group bacterium]